MKKIDQYYFNPFVSNSAQPKLGDGRMESSLAFSRRAAEHLIANEGMSSAQEQNYLNSTVPRGYVVYYIVVLPELMQGWQVYHEQFNNIDGRTNDNKATRLADKDEYWGTSVFSRNNTEVDPQSPDADYKYVSFNKIAKWRLVSKGLRIQCVDSSEEEKGTLETFCVPTSLDPTDYYYDFNSRKLQLTTTRMQNYIENLHIMRNHNSYFTTNFKNLHEYQFHLDPVNTSHEPTTLTGKMPVIRGTETTGMLNDTDTANFLQQNLDTNFNTRIFRILMKQGSKLFLQHQTNQEVAFFTSEPEHALETITEETVHNMTPVQRAQTTDALNLERESTGVAPSTNRPFVTPSPANASRYAKGNKASQRRKLNF